MLRGLILKLSTTILQARYFVRVGKMFNRRPLPLQRVLHQHSSRHPAANHPDQELAHCREFAQLFGLQLFPITSSFSPKSKEPEEPSRDVIVVNCKKLSWVYAEQIPTDCDTQNLPPILSTIDNGSKSVH